MLLTTTTALLITSRHFSEIFMNGDGHNPRLREVRRLRATTKKRDC